MDVGALALRFTRAAGLEPWLTRVVGPGLLPAARWFILLALAMWLLVLVTALGHPHLRRGLRGVPAGAGRDSLGEAARRLRRLERVMGWMGRALLAFGALVALWGWLAGAPYAGQTLVINALADLGMLQPCRRICALYGRALAAASFSSR